MKKQHNISFNEVRLSHACFFERQPPHEDRIIQIFVWFERLNRVLQQQVQLRVVHVGLASFPKLPWDPGAASSNWLEWRITRTFDSFWRLFEKKPRHFYGQNHFMSKIIVSTCAGTNWTDLNVEVSARP